MISLTEENYLKALLFLTFTDRAMTEKKGVGTNELANYLDLKPASVNEMLKKLKDKAFIHYEKYKKITLTPTGEKLGLQVLRKHRLWETFLCEKLQFSWDEVHEVAEQLEHIRSEKLIQHLDEFLGYPKFDPHGDPIPSAKGEVPQRETQRLSTAQLGETYTILAVRDTSVTFLKYLEENAMDIGTQLTLQKRVEYDKSLHIQISSKPLVLSHKVCDNILVG